MNFICNVKRINLLNSEEKNTLVRDAKKKKKNKVESMIWIYKFVCKWFYKFFYIFNKLILLTSKKKKKFKSFNLILQKFI